MFNITYIHLLSSFSRGRKDGQVWSAALSLSRFPTPCVISCLPDGGSSETIVPIFTSFWNVGNSFGWFGLLMVSSVFYWIAYSPVWNYVPHPTVILYAQVGGWESITMHTSEQKRVKKLWIQLATGQVINTADKYAFYNKFGVLLVSISLECRNNCEHRSSHKHKEGSPQEDWSFAHFKLDHFCFLLR